jgi:hypothetical protein
MYTYIAREHQHDEDAVEIAPAARPEPAE